MRALELVLGAVNLPEKLSLLRSFVTFTHLVKVKDLKLTRSFAVHQNIYQAVINSQL